MSSTGETFPIPLIRPHRIDSASSTPALAEAAGFLRAYWPRVVAISAAALAPCLWHAHIEAGDLPSHMYNAWLAHLAQTGEAPGLSIAHQWNNVLFDLMAAFFANWFGFLAAEKIATSIAVLIFFWGAFALVCALRGDDSAAAPPAPPWFLVPCLAIFAYGWSFEMGFLNYYLSIGLAFWGLALVARGRGRELGLAVALAPLIFLAHPLGLLLLIGVGAYIFVAGAFTPRVHAVLFGVAALCLVAAHFFFASHYAVIWRVGPRIPMDGTDQLRLYGPRYAALAYALEAFVVLCLLVDAFARRRNRDNVRRWWSADLLPLELYGIFLLAALLLPDVVTLPQFAAPVGLLISRMTSVSAVLLCCLVGAAKPRAWHLAGFSLLAALFFFQLYGDTGKVNAMEDQAAKYVRLVPPGSRIVATIWQPVGARIFTHHIVDRACIEQCFSYGNYEPSSGQFRLRAAAGNLFVLTNAKDSDAVERGQYIVQARDLPLFQIYQCDLNTITLCMRELVPGERNGRIGLQPH